MSSSLSHMKDIVSNIASVISGSSDRDSADVATVQTPVERTVRIRDGSARPMDNFGETHRVREGEHIRVAHKRIEEINEALYQENEYLQEELTRRKKYSDSYKRQMGVAIQQSETFKSELESHRRESERRERDYKASIKSYQQRLGLANQQTEAARNEVDALKGFLSTYDDASPDEVAVLLKDINDRIDEIACQNANQWISSPKEQTRGWGLAEDDHRMLEGILGSAFVTSLWATAPEHPCAQFLLQLAWQACIVDGVREMLDVFSPVSVVDQSDSSLLRLGQAISHGESQPVYARWRALTHQYLSLGATTEDVTLTKQQTQKTVWCCYAVALLLFNAFQLDDAQFYAAFAVGVEEVIVKGLKLATTVRERVISNDYRPLAPPMALHHGFNKLTMVAANTDTEPPAETEVLCTTRLGMMLVSKQGRERTGRVEKVFRRAEVLTKHCLDEAIRDSSAT